MKLDNEEKKNLLKKKKIKSKKSPKLIWLINHQKKELKKQN